MLAYLTWEYQEGTFMCGLHLTWACQQANFAFRVYLSVHYCWFKPASLAVSAVDVAISHICVQVLGI